MSLPAAFLRDAERLIPAERRFDDPTSTLALGTDASFYRLIPKLVVRVESEDEVVGLDALTGRQSNLMKLRLAAGRPDESLCICPPGLHEALDEREHRPASHQRPECGFVKADPDPVEVDHRKALGHFGLRQHVGSQTEFLVRRDAVVDVRLFGRKEEQDAALDQDRQAGDCAQRLPLPERFHRHARVDRVPAVGGAR